MARSDLAAGSQRRDDLSFDGHGGRVVLVQVSLDDPKVTAVRAEDEVEQVAHQRHRAQKRVDADIAGHAGDLEFRHAEVPRLPYQRSEEHTSELQSLMRISYAVFCLKKKQKSYHPTSP